MLFIPWIVARPWRRTRLLLFLNDANEKGVQRLCVFAFSRVLTGLTLASVAGGVSHTVLVHCLSVLLIGPSPHSSVQGFQLQTTPAALFWKLITGNM